MKRQDSAHEPRRKPKKHPKESPLQTIDSIPEGSSNPTSPAVPATERSTQPSKLLAATSSTSESFSTPASPSLSSPAFASYPPMGAGSVSPPLFSPPPISSLPPIPKRRSYAQAAASSSTSSSSSLSVTNKSTQLALPSTSETPLPRKPAPAFLAVPGFELTPSPTPTPSPISPPPLTSPSKVGIEKRETLLPIRPLPKEVDLRGIDIGSPSSERSKVRPLTIRKKVKDLREGDVGRKEGGNVSEGEDLDGEEGKGQGKEKEEPPTPSLEGISQSPGMCITPLSLALGLESPSTFNIPTTTREARNPIAEHESRPPTPSFTTLEEEINRLLGLSSSSSSNSFYTGGFAPEAPLTIMMARIPETPLPSASTLTPVADEGSNDEDKKRMDEIVANVPSGTKIPFTSAGDGDEGMEDIPIASPPRKLKLRNPDPESPSSENQGPPPSPPPISPSAIPGLFEPPVPPSQRSVRPKGNPLPVVLGKHGELREGGEETPEQVRENDQARIQEERRKVAAMQGKEWGAGGVVVSGSGSAEGEQGGRKGSAGARARAAIGLGEAKGKAPIDESKWPKVRIPPAKGIPQAIKDYRTHLQSDPSNPENKLGLAAVDAYEKLLHEQLTLNFREHHAAKTASEALKLCQESLALTLKRANDAEAGIHGSGSEGMMTIEAGKLLNSENDRLKKEMTEMITLDEFRAQRDAAVQEAETEKDRLTNKYKDKIEQELAALEVQLNEAQETLSKDMKEKEDLRKKYEENMEELKQDVGKSAKEVLKALDIAFDGNAPVSSADTPLAQIARTLREKVQNMKESHSATISGRFTGDDDQEGRDLEGQLNALTTAKEELQKKVQEAQEQALMNLKDYKSSIGDTALPDLEANMSLRELINIYTQRLRELAMQVQNKAHDLTRVGVSTEPDELSRLRLRNAELEHSIIEKCGVRLNELLQIFEIELATTPYPQIQAALREAKAAMERLPQAEQEYDEEKKRLSDEVSDRDRRLAKLRAEVQEMQDSISTGGIQISLQTHTRSPSGSAVTPPSELAILFAITRVELAMNEMLDARGAVGFRNNDTNNALNAAIEAIAMADALGHRNWQGRAYHWLAVVHYYADHPIEAVEALDRALAHIDEITYEKAKTSLDSWRLSHRMDRIVPKRKEAYRKQLKIKRRRSSATFKSPGSRST